MLFPDTYKATKAASIGKGYTWARYITSVTIIASGFLFGFVNHHLGFWVAFGAFIIEGILISRERYICAIRDIDKISALRHKLLDVGETEFVLEGIAADQMWRDGVVSQEVKDKLNKIHTERQEIKTKLEGFLSKIVSEYGAKTNDEGGN